MIAASASTGPRTVVSVLVTAALHVGALFGVRVVTEVPPPVVEVDTSLSELVVPPPPPPPPPVLPAPTTTPRPRARPTVDPSTVKSARATTDDAPPPPSNRAPSADAPEVPVPIITGVSIAGQSVRGVLIREGNTDVPGFEPPPGAPVKVQGYSGGVVGGTAAVSGGRGEVGPGVGGGVRLAKLTKPPRVIQRFRPRYPRELVDDEIDGKVLLRVEVRADGTTGEVEILKGTHPRLDAIAVGAVKRFRWAPGEVDGEPVTTFVNHTFRFEIVD